MGSPGAGKLPAGKYRELTLSRQRGGAEGFSPLPSYIFWPARFPLKIMLQDEMNIARFQGNKGCSNE